LHKQQPNKNDATVVSGEQERLQRAARSRTASRLIVAVQATDQIGELFYWDVKKKRRRHQGDRLASSLGRPRSRQLGEL